MQEQNFEKQVQLKLDELSLKPSAPVWQKVEQEIRQKKERKRALVFWALALLLIGSGSFWGMYTARHSNDNKMTGSTTISSQSRSNPRFPKSQQSGASISKEPTSITEDSNNIPTDTEKTTSQKSNATSVLTAETPHLETALEQTNIPPKLAPKSETALAKTQSTQDIASHKRQFNPSKSKRKEKRPAQPISNNFILQSTASNTNEQQIKTNHTTGESIQTVANDTSIAMADQKETAALLKPNEDTSPAIDSTLSKKVQKKASKWSWSVQAAYGVSSLQTELLSKSTRPPETFSQPIGNAGFPTPLPAASKVENGRSSHLNFTVRRSITKRLSATGALQYSYFSTKNQVGQTVSRDTSVRLSNNTSTIINQYYRNVDNGPTKEYTNKYHFIELPVGIEWQAFKRIPLKLQTGISLSYLVGSNALVHDRMAGIYYHNNDLWRRTQLHFFSGLSYQVWKLGKKGVHIGPYLQFGVSDLKKESNNYHLLSTGIKTQVSF
ncbi:MAG TPA: hypothetical protein VD794_00775 [Flavisolibacter sp.]|nr:hypothetical protein [Flavisolibacter sp.]